jgi:hypothetical protein
MTDIFTDYLEVLDRSGQSYHQTTDDGEPAEFQSSEHEAELYTETAERLTRGFGDRWSMRDATADVQIWIDDDGETDGSREDAVPTIVVAHGYGDKARVRLTWQMARLVAVALMQAEGVGRNG